MAKPVRKSSQIAVRYATSLLDLAEEKPGLEKIADDVAKFQRVLAASEPLSKALADPRIKDGDKVAVVDRICERAGFHQLFSSFLKTLAENGRLDSLSPILEAVLTAVRQRRGVLEVSVQSAGELDARTRENIEKLFIKRFQGDVELRVEQNSDLMGGMVVRVGPYMIDDSVKSKLERLEREMVAGSDADLQGQVRQFA